jgi:ABC-2 type transport system ATP-binding protein
MIQISDLNFEYSGKKILKNISFELSQNSVTALVGPNGAGKTTLLRCLTCLEIPLSGKIIVGEINVNEHPRDSHKAMGYLSDSFGVYNNLSVRQCLTYMAWCHNFRNQKVKNAVQEIANEVGLNSFLDAKAGTLSRGYKQRLGVGLAIIHNPKYLFLDEPASGMDPEARIKFSELILSLKARGMTIIVSSHILSELEDYCTDMLVMRDGEIKSHVKLSDYNMDKAEEESHEIVLAFTSNSINPSEIINSYAGATLLKFDNNEYVIELQGGHPEQAEFLSYLSQHNLGLYQFSPVRKTLKTAYMELAENEITKSRAL